MIKKLNRTVFIAGMVSLLASTSIAEEKKITWMGCGISKKAFMEAITKAYTAKTGIEFRMAGGGATKGIRLTAGGKANIGGTCRHLLRGDNKEVVPEENNVNLVHVAWDALVAITNKDNPIDNISSVKLKALFEGKTQKWTDSDSKGDVVLCGRKGNISGVGYMFRVMVMKDENFAFPKGTKLFASSGPLEKSIEKRFKTGLGITGISSAKKRNLKILAIDGQAPTKENVANGNYPYFRPLYMAMPASPDKNTQDLLDFILSDEGQQIISNEGTVNLKEGAVLSEKWTVSKLK